MTEATTEEPSGDRAPAAAGDGTTAAGEVRRGYIPRPPSKEELDRLSEAQALITDEWVGDRYGLSTAGRPPGSST